MDVRVGAGAARSESESGKQGKRRGKKGRTAALVPRIKESVMERKKGEEGRGREAGVEATEREAAGNT